MEGQASGKPKGITIPDNGTTSLRRSSFPKDFVFGTSASAYQYEGAADEDGKGPSIWDTFTHIPGKIVDGSNGDVAVDFYHKFKDDVKIMKDMGLKDFRFSISWSRVLPCGERGEQDKLVNEKGIQFYNKLIGELVANGITPWVTLFHWDVPQALETKYEGFLNKRIVAAFSDYADLCFKRFGDRVKHWITFNEPYSFSFFGYVIGSLAPGHGGTPTGDSNWSDRSMYRFPSISPPSERSKDGNSLSTEPFTVSHNQLLAHSAAVKLYKDNYQRWQGGKIGISLVSDWFEPYVNADHEVRTRALDFMLGWFMNPLVEGDYPESMKKLLGKQLPSFLPEQSEKLKGSFDFIGLNYYTAMYASAKPPNNDKKYSQHPHSKIYHTHHDDHGNAIGPQAPGCDWIYVHPEGIYKLVMYVKNKYNNPVIYITENGVCEANNPKLALGAALADNFREEYIRKHITYLLDAIKEGANLKGYFVWSLLDNFEWSQGYTQRFGMIYVNFQDRALTRYPKDSAKWFKKFLKEQA